MITGMGNLLLTAAERMDNDLALGSAGMEEAEGEEMPVLTMHWKGGARSRSADVEVRMVDACGMWAFVLQCPAVKAVKRRELDDKALAEAGDSYGLGQPASVGSVVIRVTNKGGSNGKRH